MVPEIVPTLCDTLPLPVVQGAASLATAASRGVPVEKLLTALSGPFATADEMFAAAFDTAVLSLLSARNALGVALQDDLLRQCRMFRVADGPAAQGRARPLRLLAFVAPGDLQMNMPLEFITQHLNVRLDLVYVLPGMELPPVMPNHDVAICAISDSDPAALERLIPLLARWPRPVLNDPGRVAGGQIGTLTRDGIARLFADTDGITSPATVSHARSAVFDFLACAFPVSSLVPDACWPLLIRPVGSHAGKSLERVESPDALRAYMDNTVAKHLYLSRFVDYRSEDGSYRKYRLALIQGQAFLCHMAVSDHWMIHYLNAGMSESAVKRADEARALAEFENGFARRQGSAIAIIQERLGLDYVILDCAEAPDGTLLLFEVEMAAIIHKLDPEDLFAYKQLPMQRIFDAFEDMLHQAAGYVMA